MIKTWKTKEEAKAIVGRLDGGTYELKHGEYERPVYKVRKIRGKNEYGIRATYYFYPNTFHAKEDGFLTVEECFYKGI